VVLALAAEIARREGFPAPVALTRVFRGDALSAEAHWQEQVISAVGDVEWERISLTDELNVVGPYARRHLERHGVVWPPMAHSNLPLVDRLAGGALLTGEGGDEVLGGRRAAIALAIKRRRIPMSTQTVRAALPLVTPRPVRAARARSEYRRFFTWLRPAAAHDAAAAVARDLTGAPLAFAAALDHEDRLRARRLGVANTRALAAEGDVMLVDPLLDLGFQRSLAAAGGRFGWIDRTDAMLNLFGRLLPSAVLRRTSKAYFDNIVFTDQSRAVAATWDGHLPPGLDDLVDAERLAEEWRAPHPNPTTFALLQAAWAWGR
jgi:asparagine synthase (glutamine-hydrolysing)